MKEISIQEIGPIRIGQAENAEAGTGCTVFIYDEGMHAGLDVRGGGPASRETPLLSPLTAAQRIHGIVLAGGSAYGLSAASGVMQYLSEHDIGFDVDVTKVPLVVQSDLFDLTVGASNVYPDEAMGYEATRRAFEAPNYKDGNYGAGCGATVGKLCGMERCMKTGIGSYAVQVGDLKIGAVIALNALGDVFDWKNGKQIAGMLTEDRSAFANSPDEMRKSFENATKRFVENTTLGVIITNARFHKGSLCKIAGLGHDGYARSIRPVHTSLDGDSIYAVSVGDVIADREVVGLMAAEVISEAIIRAVYSAESAYGFPSAKELTDQGAFTE
ncbi:MAG: P1 family peptidase [Lachnospiraceae bacterium]|nr:P1 family peptidase [Lachnospiraceae bacterium]